MAKRDAHKINRNGKLSYHKERAWNDLQKELSTNDFSLIEFEPVFNDQSYWRVNVETKKRLSPFNNTVEKQFSYFPKEEEVNKILDVFFDKKFLPQKQFWYKFEKSFQLKGLFIPLHDINKLSKEELRLQLMLYSFKARYFPFDQYFRAIKEQFVFEKIPYQYMQYGIWEYYKSYSIFIDRLKENQPEAFAALIPVLFKFKKQNTERLTHLEQILLLYKLKIKSIYFPEEMDDHYERDTLEDVHEKVLAYWNKYEDSLGFRFYTAYADNHKIKDASSIKVDLGMGKGKGVFNEETLKEDFYTLVEEDHKLYAIETVFDNEADFHLDPYFSIFFEPESVKDKIKRFFSKKNKLIYRIMEYTQSLTAEEANVQPQLKKEKIRKKKDWRALDPEERKVFQERLEEYLNQNSDRAFKRKLNEKISEYLLKIINNLTAPFLVWDIHFPRFSENYSPHWNIFNDDVVEYLEKKYKEKQEEELNELIKLEELLTKLKALNDLDKIEALRKEYSFTYSYIQEDWNLKYRSHYKIIKNKHDYRVRRMEEFGILEKGESSTAKKEIWLEEMMAIEQEVRQYIPYVKQAFNTAMPVKKTVEFDPYRHSHDGMEFDPDTFADQNKWLRGEIMKAHRDKIERGEIVQINAFALDYSGSMDHYRMRNLFKTIYLLVMGLESRKSYDAFNFFGTDFMEVVRFDEAYTNRSVLFNILSNISLIEGEEVKYRGYGGTNMSAGIIESHKRCMSFGEGLKEKFPNTDFLYSLFVITDGRPTIGILEPALLNQKIVDLRAINKTAIKGIYIKPKGSEAEDIEKYGEAFMPTIFGEDEFIESNDFGSAINQFVQIMTATYKKQRQELKEERKRKRNLNLLT